MSGLGQSVVFFDNLRPILVSMASVALAICLFELNPRAFNELHCWVPSSLHSFRLTTIWVSKAKLLQFDWARTRTFFARKGRRKQRLRVTWFICLGNLLVTTYFATRIAGFIGLISPKSKVIIHLFLVGATDYCPIFLVEFGRFDLPISVEPTLDTE
jgi:hypothetical protein